MAIPVAMLDVRVQAHVAKARSALAQGEARYAHDVCAGILEKHPDCLEVRRLLREAQCKVRGDRSGPIRRVVQRLGVAFWLVRAVRLRRRRPVAAFSCIEQALTVDPDHVGAHRLLGFTALDVGWADTAAFALAEWARLAPKDPAAFVALGTALMQAGREGEAITAAETAVRLDPNGAGAHSLLKEASVAHTLRSSGMQGPHRS